MGDDRDWTLDEDFVRAARYSEDPAEQRIRRARRVAAGHDALHAQQPPRRRRWWPVLVLLASGAVLALLALPQAEPLRDWMVRQSPQEPSGLSWGPEPQVLLTVDGDTVTVPPLPDDAAAQPLARPPAAPPGQGGYAFQAVRDGAAPVAFDPCRPVHVVVNSALAPADGAEQLQRALTTMSEATGLVFVVDGATDEPAAADRAPVQLDRYGNRWAPVLVAWTSPAQVPELAGDVLGLGGGIIYDHGDATRARYVSGLVLIDAPQIEEVPAADRDRVAQLVLLHELGHLLGLDHVGDPAQVMHEGILDSMTGLGDGDRRGLAQLGQGLCSTTA